MAVVYLLPGRFLFLLRNVISEVCTAHISLNVLVAELRTNGALSSASNTLGLFYPKDLNSSLQSEDTSRVSRTTM